MFSIYEIHIYTGSINFKFHENITAHALAAMFISLARRLWKRCGIVISSYKF